MIHARNDYNRIQDPLAVPSIDAWANIYADAHSSENTSEPIAVDEPVFVIRARDMVGHLAVECWADAAKRIGVDPEMVNAARNQAEAMREWKRINGAFMPDMPTQEVAK